MSAEQNIKCLSFRTGLDIVGIGHNVYLRVYFSSFNRFSPRLLSQGVYVCVHACMVGIPVCSRLAGRR